MAKLTITKSGMIGEMHRNIWDKNLKMKRIWISKQDNSPKVINWFQRKKIKLVEWPSQ